jgi:hypothetical protein
VENSRGHFFTQVAPKLYFPSGLTSIWYVVGLYSMSGGQVSLHVASSRNLWQTCCRRDNMTSQGARTEAWQPKEWSHVDFRIERLRSSACSS